MYKTLHHHSNTTIWYVYTCIYCRYSLYIFWIQQMQLGRVLENHFVSRWQDDMTWMDIGVLPTSGWEYPKSYTRSTESNKGKVFTRCLRHKINFKNKMQQQTSTNQIFNTYLFVCMAFPPKHAKTVVKIISTSEGFFGAPNLEILACSNTYRQQFPDAWCLLLRCLDPSSIYLSIFLPILTICVVNLGQSGWKAIFIAVYNSVHNGCVLYKLYVLLRTIHKHMPISNTRTCNILQLLPKNNYQQSVNLYIYMNIIEYMYIHNMIYTCIYLSIYLSIYLFWSFTSSVHVALPTCSSQLNPFYEQPAFPSDGLIGARQIRVQVSRWDQTRHLRLCVCAVVGWVWLLLYRHICWVPTVA